MAFAGGAGTALDPYYDRIVVGDVEIDLLNRETIKGAVALWMDKHKIRAVDFYTNGLNITYDDASVKSLKYESSGSITSITEV